MYKWGEKSLKELNTVKKDIRRVFDRVLSWNIIDIAIVEGRRDRLKQNEYFYKKKSRVMWPKGKHNVLNPEDLAGALDAAPYVNGKVSYNWKHCIFLAGLVQAAGKIEGVEIRWGGNWDMDGEPITDQDFQDLVHYEII